MGDKRAYFFSYLKNDNTWIFIAREIPYTSKTVPLEKWICKDNEYTIYRISYTKGQSNNFIKPETLNSSKSPELYCVYNDKNEDYGVVYYLPKLECLEIQIKKQGKGSKVLIEVNINFDSIKDKIIELLGIEVNSTESFVRNPDKEYSI